MRRAILRAYAAANRRDSDLIWTGNDTDVYEYRPSADLLPPDLDPVLHGHDGYLQMWQYWIDAFDDIRWDPEEILDLGDQVLVTAQQRNHGLGSERDGVPALHLRAGDTVLADVVLHGKGRVSGLQGADRYFQLFTFRARKIVRIETVRHEAEALEAAGLQRNENLARALISSWGHGDYRSVEWAHPEIEFVIADGPEPGRWTGLRGMAEGWGQVLSAWEGFYGEAEAYHELDGERVLVFNRFGGRGKRSGLEAGEVGVRAATVLHFRDGKVTRLAVYWDRERALRDLGLPVPE